MTVMLSDLLAYKNQAVVNQFCYYHKQYSLSDGEQLFQDLLAWLWLKYQRQKKKQSTYLFGPLLILDELWHTFILHTRAYTDFSLHYFGEYLHHDPEPAGFEYVLNEEELTEYINDCFNYLDTAWVERRFQEAILE